MSQHCALPRKASFCKGLRCFLSTSSTNSFIACSRVKAFVIEHSLHVELQTLLTTVEVYLLNPLSTLFSSHIGCKTGKRYAVSPQVRRRCLGMQRMHRLWLQHWRYPVRATGVQSSRFRLDLRYTLTNIHRCAELGRMPGS